MISQNRARRKITGGRLRPLRKKKKYEEGRANLETKTGKENKRFVFTRGKNMKIRTLGVEKIAVTNPKTGKTFISKIKSVANNPANPHFIRRNIITKGAIIETEKGRARVTSRPNQTGTVSAVLES